MAGIYLHIPFCRQACTYCNFHFSTSLRGKDEVVKALEQEVVAECDYLQDEEVKTIYFGGGTPSLLSATELESLLSRLHQQVAVATDAEITLEANPDDVSVQSVKTWQSLGINRLSIGVQSFFEDELRWMNRAHNAAQAHNCIEASYAGGIQNLSIDLIYGSPLLSDEGWKKNVHTAVDYGIRHLSCYALTVEEKTPLHKNINLKKAADVDSEKQARQFLLLMQWLRGAGYEHYEVSNFAKPSFRSRHNSAYWQGVPYLGLGPSAHSFNGRERRWNVANNAAYIRGMQSGQPVRETEVLTRTQRLNEMVMISLRTCEGLDFVKIAKQFGEPERRRIEGGLEKYADKGLVRVQGQHAQLTDEGMLRADGIAADLFL